MFIFIGGMPSDQIDVWSFDPQSRQTDHVHSVRELESPSFLAAHPRLPILYAVERRWSEEDESTGALTTYAIDTHTGQLERLARCRSGGGFTAHVNITPDCRHVSTANPLGPTVALFPLDDQGIPGVATAMIRHAGRGARERQSAPWPHSSYTDSSSKTLFVCDLGLDRVLMYDIEANTGTLTPARQPFAQVSSGAGARHMALRADARFAYVANELDSTISAFEYDSASGRLVIVQTISTVPSSYAGNNLPAEIVLAHEDRFIYVTNRGHDSIGVFRVDAKTGKLALEHHVNALGKTPRHIAVSADGSFAAVANQASDRVVLFAVSSAGALEDTGASIAFENPTCTAFY